MYPAPIPQSGLVLEVSEVASLPQADPGQLPRPTVLTQDPKGRLFSNDLSGPIYLVGDSPPAVEEYLDLRDYPELGIVSGFHGLQSFAFHPDFYERGAPGFGCFYVFFSSEQTGVAPDFSSGEETSFHTVLTEWRTAEPGAPVFSPAVPEHPYREVLRINQPFGGHVGGLIAFNPTVTSAHPDYGNLYVALGDGAQGGGEADPLENAENAANPYGAILRIDPTGRDSANGRYGLVPENALAADSDPATLAEVYCFGLRNPQRFGWDLVTGRHYIADIGHDVMEEVNLAGNGFHFGWDLLEGSEVLEGGNLSGLTPPIAEYDHVNFVTDPQPAKANRAITIGEVARGTCVPGLEGHLLIADFPSGILLTLDVAAASVPGGQAGLREFLVHDGDGVPRRFLALINEARAARGLPATNRADVRFGINTPGQILLINKQDGIIRRIEPVHPPRHVISKSESGEVSVSFQGILQRSHDLDTWTTVIPQPESPHRFPPSSLPAFFRSGVP